MKQMPVESFFGEIRDALALGDHAHLTLGMLASGASPSTAAPDSNGAKIRLILAVVVALEQFETA